MSFGARRDLRILSERLPAEFFVQAADAIAENIPNVERGTPEGQGHMVDPTALAPVLKRFLEGCPRPTPSREGTVGRVQTRPRRAAEQAAAR